ncbi:hypothetical protein CTI12_AA272820 [Artemisia annua]|uniref:DUF4216 domain-containing protein n=1 Tax=Artemisia annua TaxID=35608 RepID=A0A2U1NFF7_ARTAN|nr:hypothetical protein CTI12_AA272820 [Artemisia annua]
MQKVVWYVLHNSHEIDPYMNEYKRAFPGNDIQEGFPYWFGNKVHLLAFPGNDIQEGFPYWFGNKIRELKVKNDPSCTSELFALACGPSCTAVSVDSCIVNGVKFNVHDRDLRRSTQNSGISTPNPSGGMYYGQLEEIPEFEYIPFKVVLFKVKWFNTNNDVFYLDFPGKRGNFKAVQDSYHRKIWNPDIIVVEDNQDVRTDTGRPVSIRFEKNAEGMYEHVGSRTKWFSNLVGELLRTSIPMHFNSWRDVPATAKAHIDNQLHLRTPTDSVDGRDLIELYRHNHTRDGVFESLVSEARYNQMIRMRTESTSGGTTMPDLDIIRHVQSYPAVVVRRPSVPHELVIKPPRPRSTKTVQKQTEMLNMLLGWAKKQLSFLEQLATQTTTSGSQEASEDDHVITVFEPFLANLDTNA